MFYDQVKNSRFIVTDLFWLVELIDELCSTEQDDSPWDLDSLHQKLASLKINASEVNDLVGYLCDLNLLVLPNTPGSDRFLCISQIATNVTDGQLVREITSHFKWMRVD